MTDPDVKRELFGTRSCRYTAELEEDLRWNREPYTLYFVDEDDAAMDRLRKLTDPPFMVPVLVLDGRVEQIGYNGRGCYVQTDLT